MRTRIKFCGMTHPQDAANAAALGVDAIGLIFAPQSSRCVSIETAAEIAAATPPFVATVGLFLEQHEAQVRDVLERVRIDMIQFHGREPAKFCRSFGKPYLKAVPMLDTDDVAAFTRKFPDAAGFVLDSTRAGAAGGTGERFDWSRELGASTRPLILAGGLKPDNVALAIRQLRPYAVDVVTGIETAPGRKDYDKMAAFATAVHEADRFEP